MHLHDKQTYLKTKISWQASIQNFFIFKILGQGFSRYLLRDQIVTIFFFHPTKNVTNKFSQHTNLLIYLFLRQGLF